MVISVSGKARAPALPPPPCPPPRRGRVRRASLRRRWVQRPPPVKGEGWGGGRSCVRIVLSLRSDAGVADRLENCRQVAQNFRVREADDTLARCFEQRSP